MKCFSCNTEISAKATFCTSCGTRVADSATATAANIIAVTPPTPIQPPLPISLPSPIPPIAPPPPISSIPPYEVTETFSFSGNNLIMSYFGVGEFTFERLTRSAVR
jgi:hypothetical protein